MKKKIFCIFVSILISITIVLFKNGFSQTLPGKNYGMPAIIKKQNIDNLFVGSSMFKQGINPFEIGDNDYILAYNGNEPSNTLREIEYLLNNNVIINNLYVDMYAWTLARNPWIDDLTMLWDSDFKTTINIYNDLRQDASILYTYEFFVSSNNDLLLTYPISISVLNNYTYKGGNAINSVNNVDLSCLDEHNYPIKDITIGEKQVEAIIELNDLCKENNINLIYIETPKFEKEQNSESYLYIMNKYKNILNTLNIDYILANDIEFDNTNETNYIDLLHMSSIGSKEYTKKLVKLLSQ